MEEQHNDSDYLAKWLNGELSDEELQRLSSEEDLKTYKSILNEVDSWALPSLEDNSYEQLLNKRKQQLEDNTKSLPLYRNYIGLIAASVALLIGAFAIFKFVYSTNYTHYLTTKGEIQEIILPDSSVVVLNQSSEIKFDKDNWKDNRKVTLDGNAFFKVAKGKTFTVAFESGKVEVTGTQFEVLTTEKFFNVFCYEGSVITTENEFGTTASLKPGKGFHKENGKSAEVFENANRTAPNWLQPSTDYVFSRAPLSEVIYALEKNFNIKIKTELSLNRKFSGSFKKDNLETALQMVFMPLGIQYTIKKDTVFLYE